METVVPMHSIVLVPGMSGTEAARGLFPPHEVLTADAVAADLVGQANRPDLLPIVLGEMRRRMALKLSLGERVVVGASAADPQGLERFERRMGFARVAQAQGAGVVYLLDGNAGETGTVCAGEADLLGGDGLAAVARLSAAPRVAQPLGDDALAALRSRWRGITVVGDVHGKLRPMQDAMAWARSRNHFVWFLGDVVDCGEDTLDTLECAYHAVMRGEAGFVLGNHERKIARWLAHQEEGDQGGGMALSDGNRVTVAALNALARERRAQWCGRFRSLLGRASLMAHLGDVSFVHAAMHPDVWQEARPDQDAIEDAALYGEAFYGRPGAAKSQGGERGFALTYRWIDALPAGRTVFVGHDVRSTVAPLAVSGAKGGRAVFLDTGSGKGGALSSADLRFDGDGLRLENFNRH